MTSVTVVEQGHRPPGVTFTRYSDSVIYATMDHGLLMDLGNAKAARAVLHTLDGGPFVVVADLAGVPYLDRCARAYLADDEGIVVATAVVTGRDGPIDLLVDRWLVDHTVTRPVAKFERPDKALVWAHEKAAEFRATGQLL